MISKSFVWYSIFLSNYAVRGTNYNIAVMSSGFLYFEKGISRFNLEIVG